MANWKLGKLQQGFVETATSAGTLTLVKGSKQLQIFTGTSTHSLVLPDATTAATGISFVIVNQSTGLITVQYDDASTLTTVAPGAAIELLLTSISTSNGVWASVSAASAGGGLASTAPGSVITSNYTVVSGDNGRVLDVDTTAGSITITLPAPTAGFNVTIKDALGTSATNVIIIKRNGSEKIDNMASDDFIGTAFSSTSLVSDGTDWHRIGSFAGIAPATAPIGLFGGGFNAGYSAVAVIDAIVITTLGNATSFGNLTVARSEAGSASSSTRGIFATGTNGSNQSTIDYVTIATAGNATTFGTTTLTRSATSGCGSSTRGVFSGGFTALAVNDIDYVTIATTGNATSFGTLTVARYYTGACSSPTRGVIGGGYTGSVSNTIDYVTIATTGNATSFGTLSPARQVVAGCSNSTRGIFAGGYDAGIQNSIDYITIATTGNSTNFGTLTASKGGLASCASSLRGVFSGGNTGSVEIGIEYVTIATTGNATSFGNLTAARYNFSGCSNAHGGL